MVEKETSNINLQNSLSLLANPSKLLVDDFILNCKDANIFHSFEMWKVFHKTRGYVPLSIAILNDNKIIGLISGTIQNFGFNFDFFSKRSVVQGMPICQSKYKNKGIRNLLIRIYDKILHKYVLYNEIRIQSLSSYGFLENLNYKCFDHNNFFVKLGKDEKHLFNKFNRSTRKKINKCMNSGVIIKDVETNLEVSEFYKILSNNYSELGIPLSDESLFRNCFKILVNKNMAIFRLAIFDDKIIGGRVSLTFKNKIIAYYVAVSKDYKKSNVNSLLNWDVMHIGIKENYEVFDFGGAGDPNDPSKKGIFSYKSQFGGDKINLMRYKRYYIPLVFLLIQKFILVLNKVKKG